MMDPRMMQQMQQQQMLGMQRPQALGRGMQPQMPQMPMQAQALGQGMQPQQPPQIDPRTGQMIRPMQQQQAVESPLPADPMQRLKVEMLQNQAEQDRNREMLERSIQQKKVRDLAGQVSMDPRRRGMLDPQSVMRESEMDPRSVVREQEMFRRMR